MAKINVEGQRFGLLVAIRPTDRRSGTSIMWECLCDCGNTTETNLNNLRRGLSRSCGCSQFKFDDTHGMSGSRIYTLWNAIYSRVRYPERFPNHAGRGIGMCDTWGKFENFYSDMSGGYEDHLELDRIDVEGDYCKENCRWVDKSTQAFNKRLDKNNQSGKTGVYLDEKTGRWDAKIGKDGKSIYLGRFETFEGAVKAREEAEIKYFGFNKI